MARKPLTAAAKKRAQQKRYRKKVIQQKIDTLGTLGPKDRANLEKLLTTGRNSISTKAGYERAKKMFTKIENVSTKTLVKELGKKENYDIISKQVKAINATKKQAALFNKGSKEWNKVAKQYKIQGVNLPISKEIKEIYKDLKGQILEQQLTLEKLQTEVMKKIQNKVTKQLMRYTELQSLTGASISGLGDFVKALRNDSEEIYEENRELVLQYNEARSLALESSGKTKMSELNTQQKKQFNRLEPVRELQTKWSNLKNTKRN